MIRVVAHLTSRPETIEATRVALEGFIDPTRAEAGCIVYELMQNNTDRTDFTFVEEWGKRRNARCTSRIAAYHRIQRTC